MEVVDLDYAILRKISRGDQKAFAELMQRHQDRVYRLALRLLKDRQEAEDAAQEVFLKAYQHAGRFEPSGSVAGWLNRITANHCLNRLRSRALKKEVSISALEQHLIDDAGATISTHQPTPLENLEQQELAQLVQKALDSLPENQRQAMVLKRFGDFSYQDIAGIMNLSVAAVDGLIKRARQNLKKSLGDYLH